MVNDLINIAYRYYPKNLNGFDDTYFTQKSMILLKNEIKNSLENDYPIWLNLISQFNMQSKGFDALDKSNFLISNPSLQLEIIIEKKYNITKVFRCYSSLVIPYFYFVELTYEENKLIFENNINDINMLNNEINNFVSQISKSLNKEMFDKKNLDVKIPLISFENIKEGDFSIMNAFFNQNRIFL